MALRFMTLICIILLCMSVFTPDSTLAQAEKKAVTAEEDSTAQEDPLSYSRPGFEYDSSGRRDPFSSLAPPLETVEDGPKIKGLFNYEGATLKGVVNSGDDLYALVSDANGLGYVLRKGYRVFGGYVTGITEEAIQFHIVKYGRSLSIIMRLSSSRSTVVEEQTGGDTFVQKPGINVQYREGDGNVDRVTIEDVILPSLNTRTVDETWFGGEKQDDASRDDEQDADVSDENTRRFVLFDPPNASIIRLPYVLDWTTLEGASVSYRVVIDDNEDYSSPVYTKGGLKSSSCILDEETGLPTDTNLYWKVIARDADGAEVMGVRTDMVFRLR